MASTTFYLGGSNGYLNSASSNWGTARSSGAGGPDTSALKVLSNKRNDASYELWRAFLNFDTSSIPDGAVVSSCTLRLYLTGNTRNGMSSYGFYVTVSTQANPASLSNSDWTNWGTDVGGGVHDDTTNGWHEYTISTSQVSKTGYTQLALISRRDYINTAPEDNDDKEQYDFNTSAELVVVYSVAPTVTTGSVTNLGANTATLGGNVTDDGGDTITERGVCWGLTSNPTTSNSKATSAGTTGAYTVSATGMLSSNLYHYRAYATNSQGTSYGSDSTFTTNPSAFIAFI